MTTEGAQVAAPGVTLQPFPPTPTRAELEAAGIRIAVGLPMERNICDLAMLYMWEIARRGWPLIESRLYGRTDINRNSFARALLKSNYTHVFMMDLDHIHPPDVIEQHARWVLQDPSRLIVGGIHFRRGEPYDPCIFVFGEDGGLHAPLNWPRGLVRVDALGHGTLLVHRSVFEQLPFPWWFYSYPKDSAAVCPSDDIGFSEQCRKHGISMWCDTTITSPHIIHGLVSESSFRAWVEDHPQQTLTVGHTHIAAMDMDMTGAPAPAPAQDATPEPDFITQDVTQFADGAREDAAAIADDVLAPVRDDEIEVIAIGGAVGAA